MIVKSVKIFYFAKYNKFLIKQDILLKKTYGFEHKWDHICERVNYKNQGQHILN